MLETTTPAGPIYRLGRYPDPWAPPDWSNAQPDGTFGNRFDDPTAYYRVLYASSQRLSCFLETLARFRPDLALLAELQHIAGENDFFPLSQVPKAWCKSRVLGTGMTSGNYADLYAAQWVAHLRSVLAAECLKLGFKRSGRGRFATRTATPPDLTCFTRSVQARAERDLLPLALRPRP